MIAESIEKTCKVVDIIESSKIFAVVRTSDAKQAINISKALIDGGIRVIEITMAYDDADTAIREISNIDGVLVAAGSVITAEQATKGINAGARIIVSPVAEMGLIKLCKGRRVPIATAAATPTEAYNAWKIGVNIVKIFPAKALGGPDYIRDILTPMPFLHLMPTGGVNLDNFIDYLKAGATAVGMGNAFYSGETDLAAITKKAKIATERLQKYIKAECQNK